MSTTNLDIWHLISDASLLVQLVMGCLLAASLLSWYVIVQRSLFFRSLSQQDKNFLQHFRGQSLFAQVTEGNGALSRIFQAGYKAVSNLRGQGNLMQMSDSAERAMLVAISQEEEQLDEGLALLATIGSVSPYIGLFGTVWGIMNAFIGLAQVQQASLASVAPGIAEALVATAMGLFAAIPAVVAYNRFSAHSSQSKSRFYALGNEFQSRLPLQLSNTERQYA